VCAPFTGETHRIAISVQVLQKFYVQATRQTRENHTHEQAAQLVRSFCRYPVQEMTLALAYWDAAVIEAARALGCREILSEDLNHRQDYSGVRVVNPFR